MLKSYTTKLVFRIAVFISCVFIYYFKPSIMELIFTGKLYGKLSYLYLIWMVLIIGMILHLLPNAPKITMGCMKHHENHYLPDEYDYSADEMNTFIRKSDIGAIKVLIAWLALTAVIGGLYFSGYFAKRTLLLISLFFYVCDLICVVIWCPFQTFLMKNKCCVTCRIFNWGYAMMFTPLVFIASFYSWSLVIMSLIIVVRWEIVWHNHPERFWEKSNSLLQCKNCKDKICKTKRALIKAPVKE